MSPRPLNPPQSIATGTPPPLPAVIQPAVPALTTRQPIIVRTPPPLPRPVQPVVRVSVRTSNEAAGVAVCRTCGQAVCTRPGDHVLWRPEDATLFLWHPCSICDARLAGDHLNLLRAHDGFCRTPIARRAVNAVRHAPRPPKQLSIWRRVSEWLDKEPVQFALILAAGIVPLALAIFLPRAIYRVDAHDRQQIASRDPTWDNDALATSVDQSPPEVTPTAKQEAAPVPEPVVDLPQVKPIANKQPVRPDNDALFRRDNKRGVKGDLASIDDFGAVRRDRPELARRYYDRAGVWYTRAMVHQRMGRLAEALADMLAACRLDPTNREYADRLSGLRLRQQTREWQRRQYARR